jgi:hypothetical protein
MKGSYDGRTLGFGVALASAFIAIFPISGCEIFQHLAIGRTLSERILSEGIFFISEPSPDTNGWLGSLVLYKVHASFGIAGIVFFRAAMGAVTGVLLYFLASSSLPGGLIALGAMTLGLLSGWDAVFFIYPLMAFLQYLIIGYQEDKVGLRGLYIVPPLMLALDFFGGAFWGAVYLCVSVCSFAISLPGQRSLREGALNKLRLLGISSIASAALIALHPYGLRAGLVEWTASPLEALRGPYLALAVVSCLCIIYLAYKGLGLRGLRVLGALSFLVLAPFVDGGVALAAIASVPLMAEAAARLPGIGGRRRELAVIALVAVIVALGYLKLFPSSDMRLSLGADDAPLPAIRFIQGSGLVGDISYPPEFSGCAAFYLKTGMSAEPDSTAIAIVRHHLDDGQLPEDWEPESWALVYWDSVSEVYLRRVPQNRESIARLELEHLPPGTGPAQITEMAQGYLAPALAREASQLLEYWCDDALTDALARLLLMQGIASDEGLRLSEKALRGNPDNVLLKAAHGLHLYQSQGIREESERAMQRGLRIEPRQHTLALGLAFLHYDSGRYEEAYKEFDHLVAEHGSRRALYGRALALMKLGREQEASKDMELYLRGE